jgi:hypothetical protein
VKCGELGFTTAEGTLCGQNIPPGAKGCLWHSRTPQERRELAIKGSFASRRKHPPVLPSDTSAPVLDNPAGVRQLIAETIQQTRTGQLDHRLAMVVISGARAAIELAQLEVAVMVGDLERRLRLRRV